MDRIADGKRKLLEGETIDVKAWLQDAIKVVTSRALDSRSYLDAFAPFPEYLRSDELLALDLRRIYDLVPDANKRHWRMAVAELLAELGATEENAATFDVLLDLANLMPAHEVFAIAGDRLREGAFAGLRAMNGQTLFDRALKLAQDLAVQTREVRECLIGLSASPLLTPADAGLTLAALCRADPSNWTDHVHRMRRKMREMFVEYELEPSSLRAHAEGVLMAIGLQRLTSGLSRLQMTGDFDDDAQFAKGDNWLVHGLFLSDDPMIVLEAMVGGGQRGVVLVNTLDGSWETVGPMVFEHGVGTFSKPDVRVADPVARADYFEPTIVADFAARGFLREAQPT